MDTTMLRRMRWLALVLPGLTLGLARWAWLPGLVVAALGIALGRPGASRLEARLHKELEALLLPALALFALPALLAGETAQALGAFALAASLLASASLGVELESGLWLAWLAQPLSRSRLLAEKLAGVGLLLGAGLAQLGLLSEGDALAQGAVAAGLALGVAPCLALVTRHAVFAGVATSGLVITLLLELQEHPGAQAATAALLSTTGVWATFRMLARSGAEWPEHRLLRLVPASSRPASALGMLVHKELRLQLTTFLVAGLSALGCTLLTLRQPYAHFEAAMFFCALIGGAMAGIVAVGSEHRFGTLHLDAGVAPVRQVWRVKALVALAVAATTSVALPLVLCALNAAVRRSLGEVDIPSKVLFEGGGLRGVGYWSFCVLLPTVVGLAVASSVRDLSRALLGVWGAVVALGALLMGAARLGHTLAGRLFFEPGAAYVKPSRWVAPWVSGLHVSNTQAADLIAWLFLGLFLVTVGALWRVAREGWLAGSLRRAWRPLGVVALAGATSGFAMSAVFALNALTPFVPGGR